MKRFFTIVFGIVLYNTIAHAQIPYCDAEPPYNQWAYERLIHLDKSQIPTGVLYEYVYPWEEVQFFNGTATTDTCSYSDFIQAYHELYGSTFNRTNIAHISDWEIAVETFHPDKEYHHPVGIIDYQFNRIDPEAVNNNLLSVSNDQLFDVPNRPSSPYLTSTTIMASPLMSMDYDDFSAGTHYLHFSSAFVLSNTGFNLSQVESITIQINGSNVYFGMVSGLENAVIPFVVSNTDAKMTLTIILQLASSQKNYQMEAYQVTKITATSCSGGDKISVVGYPTDAGYGRGYYAAKAEATIFYADANCATKQITKPIVFVDGFDAGNEQHADKIWSKYLNKAYNENDIDKFLGDDLRSNGFDIIIFDQVKSQNYNSGGGGLIENNGLALAKFLHDFYNLHQSTIQQDFIVVGASMGGLVSRYALAWMEYVNVAHHTRLFISFDSPQGGAEIPIGLQQTLDRITQFGILRLKPSIRYMLHRSDAARQMLYNHSSQNSETIQPDSFRSIFLNNLSAIGSYPTQCRNISIVNGNREGIKKTILPNPNPDENPIINACDKELDFGLKFKQAPFCNLDICYKLRAKVFAQTESSRCKSLEYNLNPITPLFALIGGSPPFITTSKFTQSYNNTSFDIAPGSRIRKDPTEKVNWLVQGILFATTGVYKVSKNNVIHSNFVPTISSVDYTFPNVEPFNIYKNFQGVNLSKCAGTTPFDTVYAQPQDMFHVDINASVANSFKSEVYFPKPKSTCSDPNCPPYLTLNTPVPNAERLLKKAQKAIFIEEGFRADGIIESVVFKAAIGCNQVLKPIIQVLPKAVNSCLQPFEFDQPRNYKTCNGTTTTFHVFVHNIDINTYAEFSIDGTNYFKANILDDGYEITLPDNANPQVFFARSADNRSNVIGGYLDYCN